MIKKIYFKENVLTMAKKRIVNMFSNKIPITLTFSGGKDSIVLIDLVYQLIIRGKIDANLLSVHFVDEEAIFPCVEKVVYEWKDKMESVGVKFYWWCMEFKHFNCFNMLSNDETFVTWDRYKKDVWVRKKPVFAITEHPLLNPRKDSYQTFFDKYAKGKISMCGVRYAESIQRLNNAITNVTSKTLALPIYDWTDNDVWKYILENNLTIPDAYEYMYRVGIRKDKMRISQFFSIDTAKSLIKLTEFYPNLMDKINKREPNAYIISLYWHTEMFKGAKTDKDVDYKKKFFEQVAVTTFETEKKLLLQHVMNNHDISNSLWKTAYTILCTGDPKRREIRAFMARCGVERKKKYERDIKTNKQRTNS